MYTKIYSLACLALLALSLGSCKDDLAESPSGGGDAKSSYRPASEQVGKYGLVLEADVEPMKQPTGEARRIHYYQTTRDFKRNDPSGTQYPNEYALNLGLKVGEQISGVLVFVREKDNPADPTEPVRRFTRAAQFEVVEGFDYGASFRGDDPENRTVKQRVRFTGDVVFPTNFTLKDEFAATTTTELAQGDWVRGQRTRKGKWYVMAVLNYDYFDGTNPFYGIDGEHGTDLTTVELPTDRGSMSNFAGIASATRYRTSSNSVPFISNWEQLRLVSSTNDLSVSSYEVSGYADDLTFRPQGLLIQYDLQDMLAEQAMRSTVAIASNVLDFAGTYKLNDDAEIYAAFAGRNSSTGVGVPKFHAVTPKMSGLELALNEDNILFSPATAGSGAQTEFPYRYPSANRTQWNTNDLSTSRSYTLEKGSVRFISNAYYQVGAQKSSGSDYLPSWTNNNAWITTRGTGRYYFPNLSSWGQSSPRYLYTVWAMPRTENLPSAGKEATIFFSSSYSTAAEDLYVSPTGLDPEGVRNEGSALNQVRNQIYDLTIQINPLERSIARYRELLARYGQAPAGETADQAAERQKAYNVTQARIEAAEEAVNALKKKRDGLKSQNNYDARYARYQQDSIVYVAQEREARRKENSSVRAQPLFGIGYSTLPVSAYRPGYLYHAQVAAAPDLQITEVIYLKQGNQNYSMVEVYNPVSMLVDLSEYALVRLIPSGGHMAYRKADGTATDQLREAHFFPLDGDLSNSHFGLSAAGRNNAFINFNDNRRSYNPESRAVLKGANYTEDFYHHGGDVGGANNYELVLRQPNGRTLIGPSQALLIGASGYVTDPVFERWTDDAPGKYVRRIEAKAWFEPWYQELRRSLTQNVLFTLYARHDGRTSGTSAEQASTLDMNPGEGFALVRRTKQGYQVVDATAPIGAAGYGFSGTYAAYRAELNQVQSESFYSQQRLVGVNYPFLPPYRTKKLTTNWSDDWTVSTTMSSFTIGYRYPLSTVGRADWGLVIPGFNPARTWLLPQNKGG